MVDRSDQERRSAGAQRPPALRGEAATRPGRRIRATGLVVLALAAGAVFVFAREAEPEARPLARRGSIQDSGVRATPTSPQRVRLDTPSGAPEAPRPALAVGSRRARPGLERIRAMWIAAADAGAPDAAIDSLRSRLDSLAPGTDESKLAQSALADLEALRARREGWADPEPLDPEAEAWRAEEALARAADALRSSSDPRDLRSALRHVARSRADAAADAAVDAGALPDPAQEAHRVRVLWRLAADGVETTRGTTIRDALERAAGQRDIRAAALARQAIADLDRLEAQARRASDARS